MKCKYRPHSWYHEVCKKPSKNRFCEEHIKIKCTVCSEQATRECSVAVPGVSFCKAPLCDFHVYCKKHLEPVKLGTVRAPSKRSV